MILADTSVWVDHFRSPIRQLSQLIAQRELAIHPFVVGELAVGQFRDRVKSLSSLMALPQAEQVFQADFLRFIESNQLFGTGLGFVDIHLLAACKDQKHVLWARDKRLHTKAATLGCVYDPV
jgi:predicted nucleic acid-binding protein